MAHGLMIALGLLATAQPQPLYAPPSMAPPGTPYARYCLRVDPLIGSHVETIQCKTRDEWADLGVDVDQEWAENGVKVIDRIVVTG